jgi:hypothetical protein
VSVAFLAHDMRNEFGETFVPVLRGTRELNRENKHVNVKRNGGMKGKTRKRSADLVKRSPTGTRRIHAECEGLRPSGG